MFVRTMTSGWRISIERSSMSLRKPYFEYSCSPVVLQLRVVSKSYKMWRERGIHAPLDGWEGLLEETVSVKVVRVEALLPPGDVNIGVHALLGNLDGIGDIERHVAIDHDGETGERCSQLEVSNEATKRRSGPDDGTTDSGPTDSRCLRRNSMFFFIPMWPSEGWKGRGTLEPKKPISFT